MQTASQKKKDQANMKSTFTTKDNGERQPNSNRRYPVTDFNYHSVALDGCNGRAVRTVAPSFLNISRTYFKDEARQDFVGEAMFFVAIIATTALPMLNGVHAVLDLIRAFSGI